MSPVVIDSIFLGAYALAGPITWIGFGIAMRCGRRRMTLIKGELPPPPSDLPRVSIIIPAKDEEGQIARCLESVVAQKYPDFEVIAVNDRSTDRTGAILDEIASRDARLRVMHVRTLPAGWTGKNNALCTALAEARGEWLLFVDADVVLEPDALVTTMTIAAERNVDLLSVVPALRSETYWESLIAPLGGAIVSSMAMVALTNHNHFRKIAWANGQYLMVRRAVYDAIGGHRAVSGQIGEDVVLAQRAKLAGYTTRVQWATDLAAVRMYSSLPGLVRGWSRTFYTGSFGRPWRILLTITFLIACCFSAYLAIALGIERRFHPKDAYDGYAWIFAGIVHLALLTQFLRVSYAWSGNPRRNAFLFPLGGTLMIGILLRALWQTITGRVEWRGTSYSMHAPVEGVGATSEQATPSVVSKIG
jgi:chlorobactene glucosyltransferase